ncbi:MAG: hypothetical protein EPN91_00790 [Salinibacterium sp.]|nr:MAG: hypothetical protein EPN91_00790 [Salinibacterium sp.]
MKRERGNPTDRLVSAVDLWRRAKQCGGPSAKGEAHLLRKIATLAKTVADQIEARAVSAPER